MKLLSLFGLIISAQQKNKMSYLSPIRISNKINIPDICTPFSPKSTFTPHSNKNIDNARLIRDRAQILSLKDDKLYDQALTKVNSLINHYPQDTRLHQIKGEIVFQLKMYDKALQTYDHLLALTVINESKQIVNPNNLNSQSALLELKRIRALYYFNKGLCLQKLNRQQQAIQVLKKSRELNKNKMQTYVYLAQSYKAIGNMEKVYKIYQKVVKNNPKRSQYLLKAIKMLSAESDKKLLMKIIDEGISYWRRQPIAESESILLNLYKHKADIFKSQSRFADAINTYEELLCFNLQPQKAVKIYSKLAGCYDLIGNLDQSCVYLKKILQINADDLNVINNLGNIYIRKGEYHQALGILNTAILNMLSDPNNQQFILVMLRCHRFIALTKMNFISQASSDLKEIVNIIQNNKLIEINEPKQWQNYNFVKYIIQKYKNSLNQLNQLQQSFENKEGQNEEVKQLQKQLVCSISLELHSNDQQPKVDLQKLQQRIDRLYGQIVSLKKNTMQQHEQNTYKVHQRIDQITDMLQKRQEDREKMDSQLKMLKKQHNDIYKLVEECKQVQSQKLKNIIEKLKKDNQHATAIYIQQMYWVFNAYFISIRLIANNLVPHPNHIHTRKLSSFFQQFKGLFTTISHIPHLGTVCEIVTTILTFYLNQESKTVYEILNRIITVNYCGQKDLHKALEQALVNLAYSCYIPAAISQYKDKNIVKQMSVYNRACSWFRQKKRGLINKMLKIDNQKTHGELEMIQELVVEDVSAVFVYMIKNQYHDVQKDPNGNIFADSIRKTLSLGLKKNEISSLYARETSKESISQKKCNSCTECQIYNITVPSTFPSIQTNPNQIFDQLIKDSISQNNLELFNYALSQMTFNFK